MSDVREKATDEKFCSTCGAIIKKEAEICPKCGVRQILQQIPVVSPPVSTEKYCSSCGAKILKEAEICPKCGVRQLYVNPQTVVQSRNNVAIPKVITTISAREKISSIFYIIEASLEALIALILLFNVHDDFKFLIYAVLFGVFSTIDFLTGFRGIKFSKEMLTSTCGIMERYRKINDYISSLVIDGIFFIYCVYADVHALLYIIAVGGLVLSLFRLIRIRNFALKNSAEIMKYESRETGESVFKNRKCRMCNTMYTASQNFCPGCGSSLYEETTEGTQK
jgi:RNA polymerase subunit RPABC4/transcription elongation factor Spt4